MELVTVSIEQDIKDLKSLVDIQYTRTSGMGSENKRKTQELIDRQRQIITAKQEYNKKLKFILDNEKTNSSDSEGEE